jgi:hypothetical protein
MGIRQENIPVASKNSRICLDLIVQSWPCEQKSQKLVLFKFINYYF